MVGNLNNGYLLIIVGFKRFSKYGFRFK
jgi:hypothetical protein